MKQTRKSINCMLYSYMTVFDCLVKISGKCKYYVISLLYIFNMEYLNTMQ